MIEKSLKESSQSTRLPTNEELEIIQMRQDIVQLQSLLSQMQIIMKDMQNHFITMAFNQKNLADRLNSWPYIEVEI